MLWRPYLLETGLKALQMQRYEKLFRKPPLIGTDKYIKKIKAGQRGAFMLHKGGLGNRPCQSWPQGMEASHTSPWGATTAAYNRSGRGGGQHGVAADGEWLR